MPKINGDSWIRISAWVPQYIKGRYLSDDLTAFEKLCGDVEFKIRKTPGGKRAIFLRRDDAARLGFLPAEMRKDSDSRRGIRRAS